MSSIKILVVEDDQHLAKLLQYNLEKNGYACTVSGTGEAALGLARRGAFALVILDVMLPGIDGFQVCKQLRADELTAFLPVMMLTARGEEMDRVVGLEIGADDYVVKPFSVREFLLRVRNILSRGQGKVGKGGPKTLSAGSLWVDLAAPLVTVKGKEVVLTSTEFKLLVMLLERQGRVQSRDQLLSEVWGIDSEIETRTVDTHVKSLRQKLGPAGKLIETVRGFGYRLRAE